MEKPNIKITVNSLITYLMKIQNSINKGIDDILDSHPNFAHHAEKLIGKVRNGIRNVLK